jgi:hypothetical protein
MILNLDFTKAFDTIEHTTIVQMMQHLGFSGKWIGWYIRFSPQPLPQCYLMGSPGRI